MGLSIGFTAVMDGIDLILGLIGLLLILRFVVVLFRLRRSHPLWRAVVKLTDPFLALTYRILGLPMARAPYGGALGPSSSELVGVLAALLLLWVVRTLIVALFRLVLVIPGMFAHPLSGLGSLLQYLVILAFDLYGLALLVRVLFSWLRVPYTSRLMRVLWDVTEPVLAPLRRVLPPWGGIDFSPLIAFFLLRLLEQFVLSILSWIF